MANPISSQLVSPRPARILKLLAVAVLALALPLLVQSAHGRDRAADVPAQPTNIDLIIDDIEVTQSVQNLDNDVPLINGKRTFIRVYARSNSGSHLTTAEVRLTAGTVTTTLFPVNPPGWLLPVKPSYLRLINSHAFLFEIPTFWTFLQNLQVTAEINPNKVWWPRSPKETTYGNNTMTEQISFEPVQTMHLVLVTQPYIIQGTTYTPTFLDQFRLYTWVKQAYPVSKIKLYIRQLPAVTAVRNLDPKTNGWVLSYPSCGWVNNWLNSNRTQIVGHPFYPDDIVFYGLVSDGGGFMRGCAPGIPKAGWNTIRMASGPTGSGTFGWDLDGSYGDWYGGHEIAHAYGRWHVKGGPGSVEDGCGGEKKGVKAHPDGYISPTTNLFDPQANYGFDARNLTTGKSPIYGPNWHDVMTYCNYQWISDITYEQLLDTFQSVLPLAQGPRQGAAEPLLSVSGLITLDIPETAELLPVMTVTAERPAAETGSYAIVLRDESGDELSRYPFTPLENDPGPAPFDDTTPPVAYIHEMVPPEPTAVRLEIENEIGAVIGAIEAGPGVPRVTVLSPNGGEVLNASGRVDISWEATDPDGDPLRYAVDYSANGGASWEPLTAVLTDTQVSLAQTNLPASESALIRVRASDGLRMGQDVSDDTFTMPNHLPQVEILSPPNELTIAIGQSLYLSAEAYDIDLGSMDDEHLQWVSSEDGDLGTGESLTITDLSEGQHEIVLEVDDGQGGVVSDFRVIQVVDNPSLLPPPPGQIVAQPETILLNSSPGPLTAEVYIENANPQQVIGWAAADDQPWLELSDATGTTPGVLAAVVDASGLAPGDYTANITVTSPDLPRTQAIVQVSLTVPQYRTTIPLIRR